MVRYRWLVKGVDRGGYRAYRANRDSKSLFKEVSEDFVWALQINPPSSTVTRGHLERADRFGTRILISYVPAPAPLKYWILDDGGPDGFPEILRGWRNET